MPNLMESQKSLDPISTSNLNLLKLMPSEYGQKRVDMSMIQSNLSSIAGRQDMDYDMNSPISAGLQKLIQSPYDKFPGGGLGRSDDMVLVQ